MKIVLAPDSFKGSLSAMEVCQAMAAGIRSVDPKAEIVMLPMADGGEGTVEGLTNAYQGQMIHTQVTGPAGRPVDASYGILNQSLCIVEVAQTSGLTLLSEEERDPKTTTTYGLGELILDALNRGCKSFIVGLGGSGTNDGGCGMAKALGYEFIDKQGNPLQGPMNGGCLDQIAQIRKDKVDPRILAAEFRAACDVTNPLCGEHGASAVFGPQKGATPEDVKFLDARLAHMAEIVKEDLGKDVLEQPGTGAAGGLGAGVIAFLDGQLCKGVQIIAELLGLEEAMIGANLVITGEGRCDRQTLGGKTPYGVISAAAKQNIPSMIIAGSVGEGLEPLYEMGVTEIIGIKDETMTLEYATEHASTLIAGAAMKAFADFRRNHEEA